MGSSQWLLWLGAYVVGFAAQFALESWDVRFTNAVTGRYAGLSEARMRGKVAGARKWWLLLYVLGSADTASVFGGPATFACLWLGGACGGRWGLGHSMWQKWRRLNGGRPDEGEEDG